MRRAALLGVVLAGPAFGAAELPRDLVRLQGLDKVTARVSTFDVAIGDAVAFGTLRVEAQACFVALPTAPPESAAFLRIVDEPPAGEPQTVFSGWMYASSPAVSALDHAVYDVWVLECLDSASVRAAEAAAEEPEAEPRGAPRRRPAP
ncbi:MAG: DUF2155 domain-containing protein [Pseudomonadota bacterium]